MIKISIKYQVVSIMGILIALYLILNTYYLIPVLAQSQNCGGGTGARAQGLVTAPELAGKFGTSGGCVVDTKTAFLPFRIPNFADLKSIYYDQSKLSKNTLSGNTLPGNFSGDGLYLRAGDLDVSSSPTGSGTQVIFVEGNLSISKDLKYHTSDGDGGLIFIVKDNVLINKDVIQIDAVIISSGIIYTAVLSGQTSCQISAQPASALTINGSLISLDLNTQIRFCRTLTNNNQPAEVINTQVKYLVLLRELLSDTLERWSEIP